MLKQILRYTGFRITHSSWFEKATSQIAYIPESHIISKVDLVRKYKVEWKENKKKMKIVG